MRSILIVIFIAVFVIVTLPVVLILSLVRRKNEKKAERAAHACICFAFKVIGFLAGVRLTVNGLENVPDDKPVLYIGNHRSFFDILVTYPLCKLPTTYVAKSEVQHIPFFGIWGVLIRAIFFDRNNAKDSVKMILDCTARLNDDTSVFIFPEGTRNKNEDQKQLLEFHNGSFKMAVKSGAPVIPVAISHSVDVWEAHSPWVRSTKVTVSYGKPVYIKELDRDTQKNIGSYMRDKIIEMLD